MDYELIEAYRKISPKYTSLKTKPWKDFLQFMMQISQSYTIPTSGIMLDIGTGNCRNLLFFEDQKWEHIGIDISFELLHNAITLEENKIYRVNSDMKFLSLINNFADLALCIATLHHLRNKNDVVEVLRSIRSTLKKNNYLIVSCWRRWKKGSRRKMLKEVIFYPHKKLRNRLWRHGDIYLPWFDNNRKIVAERYYHLFTKRELVNIVQRSGFEIVNLSKLGGVKGDDNIFLLLRNKIQ